MSLTERQRTTGAIALLVVVAVLALAQSWNRWLDPIIDTGRDLYVSEALSHGAKLYRDLRYQYPPLTPYLLAGVNAVAGSSLALFTAIGILQSAIVGLLLWLAVPRWGGFAAALMFVALSLAGASTWAANFIFPYAYAATFGIAFFLAALVCFTRDRPALAIACLVAASWCKLEYAIGAVFIVAVLAIGRRLRAMHIAAFAGAMALTVGLAYAVFGVALQQNVLFKSLTEGAVARQFFSSVSGTDAWQRNVVLALLGALAIAAIAWLGRARPLLGTIALVAAAMLFTSDTFFRGWGALQYVALVVGLLNRKSPLLYFAAFSIAATIRVPLNTTPAWYGFALVVPMYALVAYVLFVELPSRGIRTNWWFAVIVAICARDLWQQRQLYALKSHVIATPRGNLFDVNPDRAVALTELISSVRGSTLVVMPEGATINYFSGRPTPISYYMFTPPETGSPQVERLVLEEIREKRPEEIAILSRDVTEYGSSGFGVDYDRQIATYVLENYSVKRDWRLPRFQAALFTRR